jgi:hypothetical protein
MYSSLSVIPFGHLTAATALEIFFSPKNSDEGEILAALVDKKVRAGDKENCLK